MEKKLASQKQYVNNKGIHCPKCDDTDIEGVNSLQADGGTAFQFIRCNSCGFRWTDIYTLTGYSTR